MQSNKAEMKTHEDFVSYETARHLKKLGFDWECIAEYGAEPDGKPILIGSTAFVFRNSEEKGRDVAAPSLSQAHKWLREVKGIHVYPVMESVNEVAYDCIVCHLHYDCIRMRTDNREHFASYEAALSAGLDAALKLLEERI